MRHVEHQHQNKKNKDKQTGGTIESNLKQLNNQQYVKFKLMSSVDNQLNNWQLLFKIINIWKPLGDLDRRLQFTFFSSYTVAHNVGIMFNFRHNCLFIPIYMQL